MSTHPNVIPRITPDGVIWLYGASNQEESESVTVPEINSSTRPDRSLEYLWVGCPGVSVVFLSVNKARRGTCMYIPKLGVESGLPYSRTK